MYIYIIIPSCKAGFEKRSVKPLSEGKTWIRVLLCKRARV